MITFSQKGDLSKFTKYLERIKKGARISILEKYGKQGVEALRAATPVDTGLTADSWYYEVEATNGGASITFYNSNVNKHVNIAVILQYGHGTRNGGWVSGRDYINPAIQPIFEDMVDEAWREVTSV